MEDQPDNIVLNILREMRKETGAFHRETRFALQQTNERLAAMEHHLAGLVVSANRFTDDVDELRARISRIEHRLDLNEDPTGDT